MRKLLYILVVTMVATSIVSCKTASKVVTVHDTITVDRVVTERVLVHDSLTSVQEEERKVTVHDSVTVRENEQESTIRREYDELGRLRAEIFNLRQKDALTTSGSLAVTQDNSELVLSQGSSQETALEDSTAFKQGTHSSSTTKPKQSPIPAVLLAAVLTGIILYIGYKSGKS